MDEEVDGTQPIMEERILTQLHPLIPFSESQKSHPSASYMSEMSGLNDSGEWSPLFLLMLLWLRHL